MENLARYIIRAFLSRLLFCAGGASLRKARPGATRLPTVGLNYALFQTWVFKYTGLVIGLGQGMTHIPEESKVIYQSKDGKKREGLGLGESDEAQRIFEVKTPSIMWNNIFPVIMPDPISFFILKSITLQISIKPCLVLPPAGGIRVRIFFRDDFKFANQGCMIG